MRVVNRSAVVVRPKQPYVEWALGTDDRALEHEELLRSRIAVYLVPPDPREENESAPLRSFFREIFDHELEAWCTDVALWPKRRTLEVFQKWFDVHAESVVPDLSDDILKVEEW